MARRVAAAEAGAGAALPGPGGGERGERGEPPHPGWPRAAPLSVGGAPRAPLLTRVCVLHKAPLQLAGGARGESGANARSPRLGGRLLLLAFGRAGEGRRGEHLSPSS